MGVIGSAGTEASYLIRPRHLRQHHVRAERKADIAEGRFAQRQAEDPFFGDSGRFDRQGKEYDEKGPLDGATFAELLSDDDFDVFVCGPSDCVASTEKSLNAVEPCCFRLFKQDMGVAIGPPISAAEEELPPLEPRSIDFVRTRRKAIWTPERGASWSSPSLSGSRRLFSCRTRICGTRAQNIIADKTAKVRKTSAKADEGHRLLCSVIPMSAVEIDL